MNKKDEQELIADGTNVKREAHSDVVRRSSFVSRPS
jgi:hypothetical protein